MNNWYKSLNKSKYSPPSYVFSIVWSILYALIFLSFIFTLKTRECDIKCFLPFILQIIINLSWTYTFFNLKKIKLSLIMILVIIILTILSYINFYKFNKLSANLLIPYLLWLLLAFYLNAYIVYYN